MTSPARVRVKICCINSVEEAILAIEHGASALGLVSSMPSGPGVIDEALIAEIVQRVPPPIATFLLTSAQDTDAIVEQQRRTRVNTIQIVDRLVTGTYEDLRRRMPGVKLVQVVHVSGPEAIEDARSVEQSVDAILLDSGNQKLAVKELGGTGRTHDWTLSRRICDIVNVPVFLAGGLKAENVAQAVNTVRPFAVDVCTGVRTDGRLDPVKLRAFFEELGKHDSA